MSRAYEEPRFWRRKQKKWSVSANMERLIVPEVPGMLEEKNFLMTELQGTLRTQIKKVKKLWLYIFLQEVFSS